MSIICQPEETSNLAIFDVNKHESTVLKSLLVNCFLVDMVHEKRIFPILYTVKCIHKWGKCRYLLLLQVGHG